MKALTIAALLLVAAPASAATQKIAIVLWTQTSTTVGAWPVDRVKGSFVDVAAWNTENSFGAVAYTFDMYGYYFGHPEIGCQDTAKMQALAIADGYVASQYFRTFYMAADCGASYYEGVGSLPLFAQPMQHLLFNFNGQVGTWTRGPGGMTCTNASGSYVMLNGATISCTTSVFTQFGPSGSGGDTGLGHYAAYLKSSLGWLAAARKQSVTTDGIYALAPLETASAGTQDLRAKTLWLEYRQPATYEPAYFAGVYLYKQGLLLDGSPDGLLGPNSGGSSALVIGQTYYDPFEQVAVKVLSTSPTEAKVQVTFGAAACVRNAPTVVVTPTTQQGAPGGSVVFTATVTNTDSPGCAAGDFPLQSLAPTYAPASLNLSSGQSGTSTITVASNATPAGTYPMAVKAFNAASPALVGSASADYNLLAVGSSATYVKTDTTTSGAWRGVYGKTGWSIPGDSESLPSVVTFAPVGVQVFDYGYTTDLRALQSGPDPSKHHFANWQSGNDESFDLNLTDGLEHQVAFYAYTGGCLSNGSSPQMTLTVVDGSNQSVVLDTRPLVATGQYVAWKVRGKVKVRVRGLTCGSWVSGVFID